MLSVFLFVIFLVNLASSADHGAVDCSMGSKSCNSCHAAYPFCYWCDGQCRKYYGKKIADIECTGEVMYESCPREGEKERLEKMLKLLESLKQAHKPHKASSSSLHQYWGNANGNRYQLLPKPTESVKKARLLRVLKLLKLLAALEAKKKLRGKTSARKIGNSLESNHFTKRPLKNKGMSEENVIDSSSKGKNHEDKTDADLEAILRLVDEKAKVTAPHVEVSKETPKTTEKIQPTKRVTVGRTEKLTTKKQNLLHHQKNSIPTQTVNFNSSTATMKPTTRSKYCELFEKEEECNNDHECSWCNLLSQCIGRNKEDFKTCAANEKRSDLEDGYDVNDVCGTLNDCKSCTGNGKCFWCEKTKSCHIYPFFGFIPHNCPANMWYYKECDVQLAIFIILFPLLLILLSMVIFYFCLRYCYYRKRTLRVQLFEKPELFERRKGKKVYFVGGDDEDDESRSEQIRQKYNLPHEKEPLISP